MIALHENRKFLHTTKGLLHPVAEAIGKASFFLFTGRPPKKVGRREARRRCSRRANAPRPLLADFPWRPARYHKFILFYISSALSADTPERLSPERHFQPFGQGFPFSFSPGKKKRESGKAASWPFAWRGTSAYRIIIYHKKGLSFPIMGGNPFFLLLSIVYIIRLFLKNLLKL